jgi:hypothetical protein
MAGLFAGTVAVVWSGSCVPICGCSPPVGPEVVVAVVFQESQVLTRVGATTVVRAWGSTVDGERTALEGTVFFEMSDPSVATVEVDESGQAIITGVAVGQAQLTASYQQLSATLPVSVLGSQ